MDRLNGALVGVLLSQSASPSVVCLSSPRSTYLGFLTEGKSAAIFITPSSWGSQRAGHLPRIKHIFWRRCRGGSRRLLRGEFFAHTSFTLFNCFALLYFYLHRFMKNTKKISSFYSCYFCWSIIVLLYHAFYQWLVSLKLNLLARWVHGRTTKIL
jgi:hypothetical protein